MNIEHIDALLKSLQEATRVAIKTKNDMIIANRKEQTKSLQDLTWLTECEVSHHVDEFKCHHLNILIAGPKLQNVLARVGQWTIRVKEEKESGIVLTMNNVPHISAKLSPFGTFGLKMLTEMIHDFPPSKITYDTNIADLYLAMYQAYAETTNIEI